MAKLMKIEEARKIIEDGLEGVQWRTKEVPLHQCLGMYFSEDVDYDEETYKAEGACLKKGHRIRPIDVSLLATIGKVIIHVFEKPVVSIISIGEELVSVIEEPIGGKVRDSNSFALAALVQETGCDVGGVYLIGDNKDKVKQTFQEALQRSDLLLVSGGTLGGEKAVTFESIQEMGSPGIMVNGLDLSYAESTVLGIIEDSHCACCNRKSLIAGLPTESQGVFTAYEALIDGLIKKAFFA